MKRIALLSLSVAWLAGPVHAEAIKQACLQSERANGNGQLCRCIQHAANLTLSERDQRLAATFFRDPHRAQEIRQSDRRAHETFWQRYQNFGTTAESICRS